MLSYSQFAFVAALITAVLASIAYLWAMSAGHRATHPTLGGVARPRSRDPPTPRLRGRAA